MKKVFLSALVLAAVLFVACGSNKAIEQQKELWNSSIAKLDSITTMEQFQTYQEEFLADQAAYMAEHAETLKEGVTEEELAEVSALSVLWSEKMQAKNDSLVAAMSAVDSL